MSETCTVPVGAGAPASGALAVTVKTKVTGSPYTGAAGMDWTETVVGLRASFTVMGPPWTMLLSSSSSEITRCEST